MLPCYHPRLLLDLYGRLNLENPIAYACQVRQRNQQHLAALSRGWDIAEMEHALLPGLHEQPHALGPSHPLIESGTGRTTFTLMTALATALGGHDVYVIMAFEGDVARAHTRMGAWRQWVGLASDTGKALNQMQCLTPATFHRPDDRIVYYDHNVMAPVTHFLDP